MQKRPSVDGYSIEEHLRSLDLTEREARKMKEAFEDPEFLKLFEQYAKDISSQEAKEEQDAYLRQIEAEGNADEIYGTNVQLVVPEAHFVVKARTTDRTKVFVNVCSSHKVQAAFSSQKINPATNQPGVAWDIPFIMGKLGDSTDKQGVSCKVVDFIVHEETVKRADTCHRFCAVVIETVIKESYSLRQALDHLRNSYGLSMAGKGTRIKSKYKTKQESSRPSVIAIKQSQDLRKSHEANQSMNRKETDTCDSALPSANSNQIQEPKYTLVYLHATDLSTAWSDYGRTLHDPNVSKPKAIKINVDMAGVHSGEEIDVTVTSSAMQLDVEERYHLDLQFPLEVDDAHGTAKFIKAKQQLEIILPVKQSPESVQTSDIPPRESKTQESGTEDSDAAVTTEFHEEGEKPAAEEHDSTETCIEGNDHCRENNSTGETTVEEEQDLTDKEIKWRKHAPGHDSWTHDCHLERLG